MPLDQLCRKGFVLLSEDIKNAVAEILEIDPDELTSELLLETIEAWDSVAALTIMVLLGDELGTPVMPGEIKKIKTFGDIEKLVEKIIQRGA